MDINTLFQALKELKPAQEAMAAAKKLMDAEAEPRPPYPDGGSNINTLAQQYHELLATFPKKDGKPDESAGTDNQKRILKVLADQWRAANEAHEAAVKTYRAASEPLQKKINELRSEYSTARDVLWKALEPKLPSIQAAIKAQMKDPKRQGEALAFLMERDDRFEIFANAVKSDHLTAMGVALAELTGAFDLKAASKLARDMFMPEYRGNSEDRLEVRAITKTVLDNLNKDEVVVTLQAKLDKVPLLVIENPTEQQSDEIRTRQYERRLVLSSVSQLVRRAVMVGSPELAQGIMTKLKDEDKKAVIDNAQGITQVLGTYGEANGITFDQIKTFKEMGFHIENGVTILVDRIVSTDNNSIKIKSVQQIEEILPILNDEAKKRAAQSLRESGADSLSDPAGKSTPPTLEQKQKAASYFAFANKIDPVTVAGVTVSAPAVAATPAVPDAKLTARVAELEVQLAEKTTQMDALKAAATEPQAAALAATQAAQKVAADAALAAKTAADIATENAVSKALADAKAASDKAAAEAKAAADAAATKAVADMQAAAQTHAQELAAVKAQAAAAQREAAEAKAAADAKVAISQREAAEAKAALAARPAASAAPAPQRAAPTPVAEVNPELMAKYKKIIESLPKGSDGNHENDSEILGVKQGEIIAHRVVAAVSKAVKDTAEKTPTNDVNVFLKEVTDVYDTEIAKGKASKGIGKDIKAGTKPEPRVKQDVASKAAREAVDVLKAKLPKEVTVSEVSTDAEALRKPASAPVRHDAQRGVMEV